MAETLPILDIDVDLGWEGPARRATPCKGVRCQLECRAAICIGPEHGTVGSTLLKEAAMEAVKGVNFDALVAPPPHATFHLLQTLRSKLATPSAKLTLK